MPAKISSIEQNGRLIILTPMGRPNKIQRRVFPRVVVENGVKLKLEFDNSNSLYKSIQVYDISGGGVGLTIYSKNAILIGQRAKLEIELQSMKARVRAQGEVVHCTLRNENSREFLLGIMFVQINEDDQEQLLGFVAAETQRQMASGQLKEKEAGESVAERADSEKAQPGQEGLDEESGQDERGPDKLPCAC